MPPRAKGKVFVVALEPPMQPSLMPGRATYIAEQIAPGKSTARFGREWIVGRTEKRQGVIYGRIGFRGAEGMAEIWDDSLRDFREVAVPAGLAAPFAIDTERLLLAVQPRAGIKLNGVIGAFRALLAAGGDAWRIYVPGRETTFEAWRATVSRVIEVKLRVRKPNPHYRDTPSVEALLEQAEADLAKVELRAEMGLGIDTNAPFIRESLVHIEANYGEGVFTGVRDTSSGPRESVYNTALGSEQSALEVRVSEQGEADQKELRKALRQGGLAGWLPGPASAAAPRKQVGPKEVRAVEGSAIPGNETAGE